MARGRYDVILLDTAPFLTTNDASELLSETDHVLLVVRAGKTRRLAAHRTAEILERFDAPVLGVVMNDSDETPAAQYYYTYYLDGSGKKKRTDKALVDIMKNYMANKSFSRGVETLGAEASMVFVGNTSHNVPYMLKHSDLFDERPEAYHDSAYLDQHHFYIPGWEVDTIRSEMFAAGYGFVVDYIAEVLKSMRDADYSDRYQQHFTLGSDISTRDRDGLHKTFSGLMKILYPHGEATEGAIEEILRFDPALHMFTRHAYEDVEIMGQTFHRGDRVGL